MPIDISILRTLNQFVGASAVFDNFVVYVSTDYLVKLTPMVLVILGFWFMKPQNGVSHKKTIVNGLLGCYVTMASARALSLVLPFRVRPLYNHDIDLRVPPSMVKEALDGWSSLPSDHAALSFALATVIFMLGRRWGIWALLHAAIVICLPRAYLSLHYPTDLLTGALVGIAVVVFTIKLAHNNILSRYLLQLEQTRPALFYIGAIFMLSQMTQMFDPLRKGYAFYGSLVYHLVH